MYTPHRPIWLALILILQTAGSTAAADEDVLPLLPAETDTVLYFNFEKTLRSELFQKNFATPLNIASAGSPELQELLTATGFDPLKDLKTVIIAGALPRQGERTFSHILIVLTGKFNEKKFIPGFVELVRNNKQCEIVRETDRIFMKLTFDSGTEKTELFGTVLDEQRFILGLKPDVLVALDQATRKAEPVIRKKEIVDAVKQVGPTTALYWKGTNFINTKEFAGFDDPGISKLFQGLASDPVTAKLLAKITAYHLELRIASDIKLLMILDITDVDAAKEVKPLIEKFCNQSRSLINLMVVASPKAKPVEEIARSLTVTGKGKTITIETSLSGAAVAELVKQAKEK